MFKLSKKHTAITFSLLALATVSAHATEADWIGADGVVNIHAVSDEVVLELSQDQNPIKLDMDLSYTPFIDSSNPSMLSNIRTEEDYSAPGTLIVAAEFSLQDIYTGRVDDKSTPFLELSYLELQNEQEVIINGNKVLSVTLKVPFGGIRIARNVLNLVSNKVGSTFRQVTLTGSSINTWETLARANESQLNGETGSPVTRGLLPVNYSDNFGFDASANSFEFSHDNQLFGSSGQR
jgi:hypothetical protein